MEQWLLEKQLSYCKTIIINSKYLINIVVMKPKVDTKGSNTVVNRIMEKI